jgi:hypothetical protein
MNARILVSVVLHKAAVRKTSNAGKPYLVASGREGKGEAARWWTVFTFSESTIEALEVLSEGEALAATGSFEASVWVPEGREPRVNLTLTADAILSAHKPKAKAGTASRAPSPKPQTGLAVAASSWAAPSMGGDNFDDSIPF